jgi:dTDP-4-dehydrorhamnose 3,5-epimerase
MSPNLKEMSEKVLLTPLKIIDTPNGSVMHAMARSSDGYFGFSEAYFSKINYNSINAWKRHKKMTLNLIVPVGKIRFVWLDDRVGMDNLPQEVIISQDNFCRLTVPPMIWLGFQNLSDGDSVLLNIANIEHDPNEVEQKSTDQINFNWSVIKK